MRVAFDVFGAAASFASVASDSAATEGNSAAGGATSAGLAALRSVAAARASFPVFAKHPQLSAALRGTTSGAGSASAVSVSTLLAATMTTTRVLGPHLRSQPGLCARLRVKPLDCSEAAAADFDFRVGSLCSADQLTGRPFSSDSLESVGFGNLADSVSRSKVGAD